LGNNPLKLVQRSTAWCSQAGRALGNSIYDTRLDSTSPGNSNYRTRLDSTSAGNSLHQFALDCFVPGNSLL